METEQELRLVWEPLTVGSTEVKHRIMATGHTQLYGKEETVSDRHVAHHRERAKGVRMEAQRFVEQIEGRAAEVYDIWGGNGARSRPNDGIDHQLRGRLAEVIFEGERLGRQI